MAKPQGRPTELTEEVAKAICDALANGSPKRYAAAAGGVHPATMRRWLAKGRKTTEQPYRSFCAAVKKAEALAIVERVRRIKEAGEAGTWQADAWWLERRHPEDWGNNRDLLKKLLDRLAEMEARFGGHPPAAQAAARTAGASLSTARP